MITPPRAWSVLSLLLFIVPAPRAAALIGFPPIVDPAGRDRELATRLAKAFYERAKVSQSFDSTIALYDSKAYEDSLRSCKDSLRCLGMLAFRRKAYHALYTKVVRRGNFLSIRFSWLGLEGAKYLGAEVLEGTNLANLEARAPDAINRTVAKAVGIWQYHIHPPSKGGQFPPSIAIPSDTMRRRFFLRQEDTARGERVFGFTGFEMTTTEITRSQYQSCVDARVCSPAHYDDGTCSVLLDDGSWLPSNWPDPGMGSSIPVTCVDWIQARDFCSWVGGELPTQMQWEYAARAGEGGETHWSDDEAACRGANVRDLDFVSKHPGFEATFKCHDGYADVAPVGRFPANPRGLHDIQGNVREWVRDVSNPWFFSSADSLDPKFDPSNNSWRYQVGSSYSSQDPDDIRFEARRVGWVGTSNAVTGFRCVRGVRQAAN